MTNQRDIQGLLDVWLREGSTVAPDRVMDIVADRIERQRQRGAWRFPTGEFRMPALIRLAAVAAALALVAGAAVYLGGSSHGPFPAPATSSPVPTPSMNAVPSMTTVNAIAIDVPGASGVISVTTNGETVWAATNGAILRIDVASSAVTSLSAPAQADDTKLQIADDGLWMTRSSGGHVYRLDPTTGNVQLSIELPGAAGIAFVGAELWIGRPSLGGEMLLVDRTTGAVGRSMQRGANGTPGLGDLWFTTSGSVNRVDPVSGALKATIPVVHEGNCRVTGTFPDNAWDSCFGRDVIERAATRLDPQANVVAAVAHLPPSHGGSILLVDGRAWFLGAFEDAAGHPFGGLLRLNPDTGAIERFISIGPADPDDGVVAGGALWIPDEANHRILRVEVADLGV